jgi:hypothetical protein
VLLSSRVGVALVITVGLWAGCYSEPDLTKIVCRAPKYECPDGYVCSVMADSGGGNGRCCKPEDPLCGSRTVDASSVGVSSEGGSAQSLDGVMKVDGAIDGAVSQSLDVALNIDVTTGFDGAPAADPSRDTSVVEATSDSPAGAHLDAPADQSLGPDAPISILDSAADLPPDVPADLALPDAPATLRDPGAICSVGGECTGGKCVDGHCCASSACPSCQACTGSGGTCTNKPLGTTDTVCMASATNCTAGGCNGSGGCLPAANTTACGSGICTNGADSLATGLGQWSRSTFSRYFCDGATASIAGCKVLGPNEGCPGHLACAGATSCRTSCAKDADCVAGFFCDAGTCSPYRTAGTSCSSHTQCASRVCSGSVCAECYNSDFCPGDRQFCPNGTCAACNPAVDPDCNPDGTANCMVLGWCGPRSSINSLGYPVCSCGSVRECPAGMVCVPGSTPTCMVNGGEPCVQDSDCASGSCATSGLCALSGFGAVCYNSVSSPAPTGCGAGLSCGAGPPGGPVYQYCQ